MITTATMDFQTVASYDWSRYKAWNSKVGNGNVSSEPDVDKEKRDLFISLKGILKPQESVKDTLEAKAKFDRLAEDLNPWVYSVSLPGKWIFEGIKPPTIECKNLAIAVVLKFYKKFSLYPIRISATVEEGIFIKYINHINKRELSIEVYNDLDMAAIITKEKEIITSMDIVDISDEYFSEIFRIFFER